MGFLHETLVRRVVLWCENERDAMAQAILTPMDAHKVYAALVPNKRDAVALAHVGGLYRAGCKSQWGGQLTGMECGAEARITFCGDDRQGLFIFPVGNRYEYMPRLNVLDLGEARQNLEAAVSAVMEWDAALRALYWVDSHAQSIDDFTHFTPWVADTFGEGRINVAEFDAGFRRDTHSCKLEIARLLKRTPPKNTRPMPKELLSVCRGVSALRGRMKLLERREFRSPQPGMCAVESLDVSTAVDQRFAEVAAAWGWVS